MTCLKSNAERARLNNPSGIAMAVNGTQSIKCDPPRNLNEKQYGREGVKKVNCVKKSLGASKVI